MWDEITYSFPNFNGLTEFWESKVYFGPAALNIIRIHFREKEADKWIIKASVLSGLRPRHDLKPLGVAKLLLVSMPLLWDDHVNLT